MGRGNLICIVNVVFQGLHSPKIGAKNRPQSQRQKVMYLPNFMFKNSQFKIHFDLKRQFPKAIQK